MPIRHSFGGAFKRETDVRRLRETSPRSVTYSKKPLLSPSPQITGAHRVKIRHDGASVPSWLSVCLELQLLAFMTKIAMPAPDRTLQS
jgi:hypothetical protein